MREGPTPARWLAWATAVLLAVGVASAAVVGARDPGADGSVVSAAGSTAGTVDVPGSTTTTVPFAPPPSTAVPPSTVARSTTVPKAAAAVLAAIGSTPTTTSPPAATTSTTRPPVTSTTVTTSPTSTTTPTTVPGRASVVVANRHPNAFLVKLDRQAEFTLEPGTDRNVDLPLGTDGNYTIEARAVADPTCGLGDSGAFQAGGRYRVEIVAAEGRCGTGAVPNFQLYVTQLQP
ncbi:MAG: hypothetical protein ACR2KK_02065 [Acidimicrobiales bacterium]